VYLSDGTCVFAVLDANESDVTGDGGDSTAVSKLYLYSAPATTGARVWTLKNTITIGAGALNNRAEYWSMAVDASNNIHLCWIVKTTFAVNYMKLAYAAGSWTPGSAVAAIAAPGGTIYHNRVDIDCLGTGSDNPIIVATRDNTTGSGSLAVAIAVKNNSAAWVVNTSWTVSTGLGVGNVTYEDISVSASHEAAPDGTGYHYALITCNGATGTTYPGIYVRTYQINLTTGVVVTFVANGTIDRVRARGFYDGSVANVKKWVIGAWSKATNLYDGNPTPSVLVYGYSVDASVVSTSTFTYGGYYSKFGGNITDNTGYIPMAIHYNKADKRISFSYTNGGYWSSLTFVVGATAVGSVLSSTENNGVAVTGLGLAWGNAQSRNTELHRVSHSRTSFDGWQGNYQDPSFRGYGINCTSFLRSKVQHWLQRQSSSLQDSVPAGYRCWVHNEPQGLGRR
jgi:hypothetical protein